ncbi:MAG TPA: hypothetical protein VHW71_04050 [Steroidobacteraceae bacterium]|jgi:hypothetical protein|nr:hypothetical protein [Steroidobacteraceae bacterium]
MNPRGAHCCLSCTRFEQAPAALEAAMPGLSSLSSAYAAVRGEDGICILHERYVASTSSCASFAQAFA